MDKIKNKNTNDKKLHILKIGSRQYTKLEVFLLGLVSFWLFGIYGVCIYGLYAILWYPAYQKKIQSEDDLKWLNVILIGGIILAVVGYFGISVYSVLSVLE